MVQSAKHEVIMDKIRSYAEELENGPCASYFHDSLESISVYKDILFKKIGELDFLYNMKIIESGNVTFVDVLFYAYTLPIIDGPKSSEDCLEYYIKQKAQKKNYYGRTSENKETGIIKVASFDVNTYVSKHWDSVLRYIHKTKKDACKSIVNKTRTEWNNLENIGGPLLIDYPLLSMMSPLKVIDFFLIDIGCELYHYLVKNEQNEVQPLAIPTELMFQSIIGATHKNITPDIEYDADGNIILQSTKYNTIFDTLTDVEIINKLTPENILSILKEQKLTFQNITLDDYVIYVQVLNMFISSKCTDPTKGILSTLGEITETALPDPIRSSKHKRDMVKVFKSLSKWSSYTFNIDIGDGSSGARFSFMHMSWGKLADNDYNVPVLEEKDIEQGTELATPEAVIRTGFHFDEQAYLSMDYKDLYNMPIRMFLSPFLQENIEKYLMQENFSEIYNKIENSNTKAIYSFIYQFKSKQNRADCYISYKELKQSFVVDGPLNRFISLFIKGLVELKEIGAIHEFNHIKVTKTFHIVFAEYQ